VGIPYLTLDDVGLCKRSPFNCPTRDTPVLYTEPLVPSQHIVITDSPVAMSVNIEKIPIQVMLTLCSLLPLYMHITLKITLTDLAGKNNYCIFNIKLFKNNCC